MRTTSRAGRSDCGRSCPNVDLVSVNRIRVERDRVVFEVSVNDPSLHRTTPELYRRALQLRPDLARHACVNAVGNTFASVAEDTPLPHLLEHVAIDYLVEASSDRHATHVGTSSWIDEPSGYARVQISMLDDLEVLAAFKRAVTFVNSLVRM